MPTLNPNEYAYLWSPTRQMLDKNGKPLVGGYVMLDQHGTPGVEAISYCDWNGTLNARQIMLDSLGRASAIVENDKLYDMYVYNRYNVLTYSALGVNCNGGGEGSTPLRFTSSDGTITINRNGNDIDLSVHTDASSQGVATADSEGNNGIIEFDTVTDGNISVIGVGSLSINPGKLYHVTLQVELSNSTQSDVYYECTLLDSENVSHKFTLDCSRSAQIVDLSWDLRATHDYVKFFVNAPDSVIVTAATLYIHAVAANVNASSGITSVVTDGTTIAGNGTEDSPLSVINNLPSASSSDEGKVLTVDSNGDPDWKDPPTFTQEQADWNENDSSKVDYIKNKPSIPTKTSDLTNDSGYITSSDIPPQQQSDWNETDASDPSYIQNKPVIPDGVPEVTSSDNDKVLTASYEGGVGSYSWQPASGGNVVINTIYLEDSSIVFSEVLQKLSAGEIFVGIELGSPKTHPGSLFTVTSFDLWYITFTLIQRKWDNDILQCWEYILNPPEVQGQTCRWQNRHFECGAKEIPTITSFDNDKVLTASYVDGVASYSWQNIPGGGSTTFKLVEYGDTTIDWQTMYEEIQSGIGYIVYDRLPTTDVYYTVENITSTSYDAQNAGISWKAAVSTQNGLAVWHFYATLGNGGKVSWGIIEFSGGINPQKQSDWNQTDTEAVDYIKNKPTIPSAQVNSDWNAVSGVAQILNKPSLATVATTGSYNDLSNKPTIPEAPVQSNWNETDSSSLAYIQNKPSIPAAQVNSDWNAVSGVAQILNKPSVPVIGTITL